MNLQILFFLLFIQCLFGNLLADDALIWKISFGEKRIATRCSENEQETNNSTSFSCPSSVTLLNNDLTENLQWSKIQIIETNRSYRKIRPLINGSIDNHIFAAILENSDGITPMMQSVTMKIHLRRGNASENSSLAVRWNKLQFPSSILGPWPEYKIMWPDRSATFTFSNEFPWGAGNYSLSVTDGDNRIFYIQIEHTVKNAVWIPVAEYSKWEENFLVEWDEDYSNILRPILKRVMNSITDPYTKKEDSINPDVDYFQENSTYLFYCQFTGDPFSFENTFISWQSPRCDGKKDCDPNRRKRMSFQLEYDKFLLIRAVMAKESGMYTCGYNTTRKPDLEKREFVVTDIPDGSGIYSELLSDITADTYEGDLIKIRCWFNRYRYDGSTAFIKSSNGNINGTIRLVNETKHSAILELIIPYATSHETGQYVCKAAKYDNTRFDNRVRRESENGITKFGQSKPINITVLPTWKPTFGNTTTPAKPISQSKGSPVELVCQAFGAPPPKIVWTKDGKPINCDGVKCQIETSPSARNETIQKLRILSADLDDSGKYSCSAKNRRGVETVSFDVTIEDSSRHMVVLYVCLAVALILTVVCGILAIWWFKKFSEKAKNLAQLKALKEETQKKPEGDPKELLNSAKPVNDQTDILNDIGIIIPPDMIQVDKKAWLGRGAFGKVYLGYAKNGCRIAAKFPENGLDPEQQRNLLREIKLMTYTDRHVNVLRLLGSVIENMDRGELYAVLEYCQLGSLKEYILLRKKFFQPVLFPEDVDKSIKAKITARSSYAAAAEKKNSIKCNAYSSPLHATASPAMDDSISTLDLLGFGYQIACGMAHLASKNIVHRDIALRNMLLTDLYIVKVADFGLARNQQGTSENSKDTLVPIRWMALEALDKEQFGSESDIWAFGVVLWELFSLGEEPFAEFSERTPLVINLKEGVRLPKPENCPTEVYKLMRQCWADDKTERPSFEECQHAIAKIAQWIYPDYWTRTLNLLQAVQNSPAHYANLVEPSIYLNIEDNRSDSSDESKSPGSSMDNPEYLECDNLIKRS